MGILLLDALALGSTSSVELGGHAEFRLRCAVADLDLVIPVIAWGHCVVIGKPLMLFRRHIATIRFPVEIGSGVGASSHQGKIFNLVAVRF